jgi:DNA-binding response OmpR family regulator
MRVLIVEDEARLARNVAEVLRSRCSHAVDVSHDGEDGRHLAMTNPYDLIVLDLMLPKVDGLTILKDLRGKGHRTPVLVLTARDATEDVIRGLDLGCDDYITKPFEMAELVARCKSLIRRSYDRPSPVIRAGDLAINTATRVVSRAGRDVILPAMEYRLLEYLALRENEVVSKTDILEHLYDFDCERFSNVVEVYVSSLRRRLDPGPEHTLLHTVRGQGYILGSRTS